jgi:hypothetical protein
VKVNIAEALDPLDSEGKYSYPPLRPDWSLHDYVVQLLSFGAHVEHCLMVQYLFAAYSLRAEDGPHAQVEKWRSALLTVAREEMGHLLTVQNILTLLGAPTDFGRDDSPWSKAFYPYPFTLQPFSRDTLVRFTFAEMPSEAGQAAQPGVARAIRRQPRKIDEARKTFDDDERSDVQAALKADLERLGLPKTGHRVGPTYACIIRLLSDEKGLPDSCFDEQSYEHQAGSDEWSRNYHPAPYQLTPEGDRAPPDPPHPLPKPAERAAYVQVRRVATRSDAIKALLDLSEQGEAPKIGADEFGEPSHYLRFLEAYAELNAHEPPPSRVAANPTTRIDRARADKSFTYIEAGRAHFLAQIFNQRYRLLLAYLEHTYRIARPASADRPNLRAMLMHRAFAEMYNLKTLAGLLVELPISEKPEDARKLAAPPFELPVTLALPAREADIWRQHRDLIAMCGENLEKFLAPEKFGLPD